MRHGSELSFGFDSLRQAYESKRLSPLDVVDEVLSRIERDRARLGSVWLHVRSAKELRADAALLVARHAAGDSLPLYGLPFAVKDSIDVAGMPTTVACPALAYEPAETAHVVERLVRAGAIVIGKVNLDQLATGLVGLRSPYGAPINPFDPSMIPGGSSSGSAVAVAAGHVSFALGTDTAGSGRVPAAFNNVVGFKPSRGLLSTRGLFPACRSIDCMSVFALTVADSCAVLEEASAWDPRDPFSRQEGDGMRFAPRPLTHRPRIGVPAARDLEFFGDGRAEALFERATHRFRALGCELVEIDYRPFRAAGELLYEGPWVAERLVPGGDLLASDPDAYLPVIRAILSEAKRWGALDVYRAAYRLRELRQAAVPIWRSIDALLLPTAPTIYRVNDVLDSPRTLNSNLGTYTTFANLMDLAALAIPAGFRSDGLPAGVMLVGPRGSDARLAALGEVHHQRLAGQLGATSHTFIAAERPPRSQPVPAPDSPPRVQLAVVGAHLSGEPLNHELTALGATLVRPARTSAHYRLFALAGVSPPKPGLVRDAGGCGVPVEVEIWALEEEAFGRFVSRISAPLCIGTLELEDGTRAKGFLCESHALDGAIEISEYGGWRAYRRACA